MKNHVVVIIVLLFAVVFLVAGTERVGATDYPIRMGNLPAESGDMEPMAPMSGTTTRVSVGSGVTEGNGKVWFYPSTSGDGRYVAFTSAASNLVPGDTNGNSDVFVHDRGTGQTTRVSVASDGTEGNGSSLDPAISADGRYVAFWSGASNLVAGDTNDTADIFVHDRQTGQTTRVSAASDGTEGNGSSLDPAISADGRYVAFNSQASNLVDGDTNGVEDTFVHDRETGQTTRVSLASDGTQGNDRPYGQPSISADGRYVAFTSLASNLVADDSNGERDVFVRDRQTGQTTRISVASDGTQGNSPSEYPSISADGRYVAFYSWASNLVPGSFAFMNVFVHDRQTGDTTLVSVASDGTAGDSISARPSISADGRYVAFNSLASNLAPDDTNELQDAFVHDRETGQTARVSLSSDGTQGNGHSGSWVSISADGRFVASYSAASNLVPDDTNGLDDTFVHDRETGQTTRVSVGSDGTSGGVQGNDDSHAPSISADGRYVAFASEATNLIVGDTNGAMDVLVHDRQTGQTGRVSVATDGAQGNGSSHDPSISADGRYVAFSSSATNLVAGDTNGALDVFVHDRQTGQTTRVSIASDGAQGNGSSYGPSISADGRYVAIQSEASNLVPSDTNGAIDAFVHDRQTGQTTRVSVASDGAQGNSASYSPSISGDGRYVAFYTSAGNMVSGDTNLRSDVFVHDRQTGQTTRVSVASDGTQGNDGSYYPSISADGRYVAFDAYASNLAHGDTNGMRDIFVHDQQTGQTNRVSVGSDGTQGNGGSWYTRISGDGRYVAFGSTASNLVAGDTNSVGDVFAHDRQTGETTRVSVASDGTQGNGGSIGNSISADGHYVAFWSGASNLVPGDTNSVDDVFVHEWDSVQVSQPPTAMTLTGPTELAVDSTQSFTATVAPTTTTLPITFHWEATGQVPIAQVVESVSDSISLAWENTGTKVITVTATNNAGGPVTATHTVLVLEGEVETVTPDEPATLSHAGENGTTTVDIPAGAVTETTTLVYNPAEQMPPPPGALVPAGTSFTLTAYRDGAELDGFVFQQPATITVEYEDEAVAGIEEDELRLYVREEDEWVDAATTCAPPSTYQRFPEANRLSVQICHLSLYALLGPAATTHHLYLPFLLKPAE